MQTIIENFNKKTQKGISYWIKQNTHNKLENQVHEIEDILYALIKPTNTYLRELDIWYLLA